MSILSKNSNCSGDREKLKIYRSQVAIFTSAINGLQLENCPHWISTEKCSLHRYLSPQDWIRKCTPPEPAEIDGSCFCEEVKVTRFRFPDCRCPRLRGTGWEGSSQAPAHCFWQGSFEVGARKFGCGGNFNWIMHSAGRKVQLLCARSLLRRPLMAEDSGK